MGKSLIIVGPQGSGKTKNAAAFLRAFGCSQVVDEWDGMSPLKGGDLALTNVEQFPIPRGFQVVQLQDALQFIQFGQ